jgi:phytanoyl-CoA hydroxylase
MTFDKEYYFNNGFTVAENLLSKDEIAALNAEIDRITRGQTLQRHNKLALEMEPNQEPDGKMVRRIYAPCQHYVPFKNLSVSNTVLDRVAELIGENILLHYSKLNMKPPSVGTKIKWHQDYPFYPLTNPKALAVLIYLEDATKENGCLNVIPTTANQKVYDHTENGYFAGAIADDTAFSNVVSIEGKAGTAIFMSCMTLHASAQNTSTKGRRTLIIGYRSTSAVPLYYGEMTNMMEREAKLVRGSNNFTAEVSMDNIIIPIYKDKISSIYDLQK